MKILCIGPYGITSANFGGAIRARAFVDAYSHAGHKVRYSGLVYNREGPWDLVVTSDVSGISKSIGAGLSSFFRGVALSRPMARQLCSLIESFKPDIIQVEEPYLWKLLESVKVRRLLPDVRLVYSAYNIESEMHRDDTSRSQSMDYIDIAYIEHFEKTAALSADLCFAVSDHDASVLRSWGAKSVVVVPNGSNLIKSEIGDGVSALVGYGNYLLFVSSAHGPNVHGLKEFLRFRRLEGTTTPLIIVGTIDRLLDDSFVTLGPHDRILGYVDESVLAQLYDGAAVVVIPKTSGGGSNLKAAEALISGKKVVTTALGLRGFEQFSSRVNVNVCEMGPTFVQKTDELVSDKSLTSSDLLLPSVDLSWKLVMRRGVAALSSLHIDR